MNNASSRNTPFLSPSLWDEGSHSSDYSVSSEIGNRLDASTERVGDRLAAHKRHNNARRPKRTVAKEWTNPTDYMRKKEEWELQTYLQRFAVRKPPPPLPPISYPSTADIESIAIPDCAEVFSRYPISKVAPHNHRHESNAISCSPVHGKADVGYKDYNSDQSSSATTISENEHIRASQTEQVANRTGAMNFEVSPGVFLHLHGSEETWQAACNGRVIPCLCYNCTEQLHCIAIAVSVLCPTCREISPVFASFSDAGGVGLGITDANLHTWLTNDYNEIGYYEQLPTTAAR